MTLSIECLNLLRSLQLLDLFTKLGAKNFLLCPGSRSAPLAIAAGILYEKGLINLFNSIDERSAAFHALGISSASGEISVVITTSGTAVANLLPATVEADKSCKSIILITADRPYRLKNCGSNQTVNQEDFLVSVCRSNLSTNLNGIHKDDDQKIENLIFKIKEQILKFPGPFHLNIPFEKPLTISPENKKKVLEIFELLYLKKFPKLNKLEQNNKKVRINETIFRKLNLNKAGIIVVGPYFGSP